MVLWLMAVGLGVGIESGLAWVAVLALLVTFLLVHAVLGLPREADRDRLRGWSTAGFVRFGVPISVLLVIGDVFWLIARSQLDTESEPTLPPMMLAIVLLLPLVEEFGFRLWVQTPPEERVGPLFGVGIVALGFASASSGATWVPVLSALSWSLAGALVVIWYSRPPARGTP